MKLDGFRLAVCSIIGGAISCSIGLIFAATFSFGASPFVTWIVVTAILVNFFAVAIALYLTGIKPRRIIPTIALSRYVTGYGTFNVGLAFYLTGAVAGPTCLALLGVVLILGARILHVRLLRQQEHSLLVVSAHLRGLLDQFGPETAARTARDLYGQAEASGGEPAPGYYAMLKRYYGEETP